MAKENKKITDNQIANNQEQNNQSSSFTANQSNKNTSDIYKKLFQTVRELKYLGPRFLNETVINLTKNMIDTNAVLLNDYNYKFNQCVDKIDELYFNYLKNKNAREINLDNNLNEIEADTEKSIKVINDSLLLFQQEMITRYKNEENIFIPKTVFLAANKKVNKEEYIKVITDINQRRILSNQNYNYIANDLSSKNEQQQYQFKHSLEAAKDKNEYDKTVINEEIEQKILESNRLKEEKDKELTNTINQKQRLIIENTVKTNDAISKLSADYVDLKIRSDIPFNINQGNFLEKLNENDQTYTDLEEQILVEFKNLLQQNDNEIEALRQTHRLYEEMQLSKLRQLKKTYETHTQQELKKYSKEINTIKKLDSSVENKDKIKSLLAERNKILKQIKKEYIESAKPIKQEYYEHELNYIEKFERLRTRKSESEAIKSSAIKNVHNERQYNYDKLNLELQANSNEKESLTQKDKYQENKDIYKTHLLGDIENENIRFEINEIELESYTNNINTKYEIDKLQLEREYRINLSDADLEYQKKAIKSRTNYFNVKTMLDIQRQQLINEYEALRANEDMNFEQVKNTFYTNCDNLQYDAYKIENEAKYKLIDIEFKHKQDLADLEIQHKKTLLAYNKRTLSNEKEYHENLDNISLYENRLIIEKELINETFDLFSKSLRNVIHLENYIHSNLASISHNCFEDNKKNVVLIIEFIRKIKLELVNNYYENIENILIARMNFEKDIKFKKVYESTKDEWNKFSSFSKAKKEKIAQTIASYQNTIETSKRALEEKKDEIKKINLDKKKGMITKENAQKLINDNREYIELIKRQILANKENIRKQQKLKEEHLKKIKTTEKKYNQIYIEIERNQIAEAKVYNEVLSLIQQQYNKFKADIIRTGNNFSLTRFTYNSIEKNSILMQEINNNILQTARNYFDTHFTKLVQTLTKRYNILRNDHQNNYKHLLKEKNHLIQIENNDFRTTSQTITNEYNSSIETVERETTIAKNNVFNDIKKLNAYHINNLNIYNKKINKIKDRKEYDLKLHDDNYKMYLNKYNEKNSEIVNEYLRKINSIKQQYQKNSLMLDDKNKSNQKNIKNQHLSNDSLRKNNINYLTLDYKEQIKKIDNKIKDINLKNEQFNKTLNENQTKNYQIYLENQENTKKEFDSQTKVINEKCKNRILTLQKDFKKEFKKKHGLVKL